MVMAREGLLRMLRPGALQLPSTPLICCQNMTIDRTRMECRRPARLGRMMVCRRTTAKNSVAAAAYRNERYR
jgi:hypothetical protein